MKINQQLNIVRNYIRAKDLNKPHLMKRSFTDSATLQMIVKTDAISFPAESEGLDTITDILVRDFSQNYTNVYTFCLKDSFSQANPSELSCIWLVCMTDRADGNVRLGCGSYDWTFNTELALAERLVITIEQMLVLSPSNYPQIIKWIEKLAYPFCDSNAVLEYIPELESIDLIRKTLKVRGHPPPF